MGFATLYDLTTGSQNTAIGYYAGTGITTGSNNIAIGQFAEVPNPTGSNQISIGNLIYGVGGNVGIGTNAPSAKLHVRTMSDEVARFQSDGNPYISLYR